MRHFRWDSSALKAHGGTFLAPFLFLSYTDPGWERVWPVEMTSKLMQQNEREEYHRRNIHGWDHGLPLSLNFFIYKMELMVIAYVSDKAVRKQWTFHIKLYVCFNLIYKMLGSHTISHTHAWAVQWENSA